MLLFYKKGQRKKNNVMDLRRSRTSRIILILFLIIIISVSIPYVINRLVLAHHLPFMSVIAGVDGVEQTWLVFWSSYLGCLISSIVTFVVLYLTLKQNNEQNNKNREEAHKENTILLQNQEKRFRYERAMQHVSDIRGCAVSLYHSLVNDKTDEIYTTIFLDEGTEIDFKHIRSLLITILDDYDRTYIEMQMLISYNGDRDEKTNELMKMVKQMSDELYDCISDLVWFIIISIKTSQNEISSVKSDVYEYASKNSKRIEIPNYKRIWDIIIDGKMMDIKKNRCNIVGQWHDEWGIIKDLYLASLRNLVGHFYDKAQLITESAS